MVSHNRHFIHYIANKIWWIEDGEIREYPGTYGEFVDWYAKQEEQKKFTESTLKQTAPKQEKVPVAAKKEVNPTNTRELKQVKQQLEETEKQVTQLEQQQAALEKELARPDVFSNSDRLQEVNTQYTANKAKLEMTQEKWEELMLKVEELES